MVRGMDTTVRTRTRIVRTLIETRGYAPLARSIGTSPGYLHDIAHGRRNGSVDVLTKIADEFGIELEDIADVPDQAVA